MRCIGNKQPILVPQRMLGKPPHNLIGAITWEDEMEEVGLGTGVLISPDLILTAAHNLVDFSNK